MTEYVKGIIFFLIFVSFAGIILPGGKYKSYINIVFGFVAMFLVFRPFADPGGIIGGISETLSEAQYRYLSESAGESRGSLIAGALEAQMRGQISRAAGALGYELVSLGTEADPETGGLLSVSAALSAAGGSTDEAAASAVPPIHIAPITLPGGEAGANSGSPQTGGGTDPATAIKKMISDFYRLPPEHIHVTIQ